MPDRHAVGHDLKEFGSGPFLAGHFHLQRLSLAIKQIQKRQKRPAALEPVTGFIRRPAHERQAPHPQSMTTKVDPAITDDSLIKLAVRYAAACEDLSQPELGIRSGMRTDSRVAPRHFCGTFGTKDRQSPLQIIMRVLAGLVHIDHLASLDDTLEAPSQPPALATGDEQDEQPLASCQQIFPRRGGYLAGVTYIDWARGLAARLRPAVWNRPAR
jgi:hypothetical protein